MPVRTAIVLAVLATVGLVGALVEQSGRSATPVAATTTSPQPDTNRIVKSKGPLQGAILIADRGNDRILLVDAHHRIIWRFPTNADRARGIHLVFDDDTFVQPGGKALITNEEDHQDILSIDIKTHRVKILYGRPGIKGNGPGELNWPDDAYVLPDGTMTVADAYNCRIIFVRNRQIVRQIGRTGGCVHDPPRTLQNVNGDTPMPGGGVLVSEFPSATSSVSWVDAFSKTGKLLWAFQAPVSYPSDPQPLPGGKRILLADYAYPGAALIVDRRGHVLWRYRPTAGIGVLNHPSLAIMLPNGNIAINDDFNHRVVIVSRKTGRIVWHYGVSGHSGTGPGLLNTPDGMDYIPLGVNEKPLWSLVHHP